MFDNSDLPLSVCTYVVFGFGFVCVPCERIVIHVIEDFSCLSFFRVFLAEKMCL